jgi:excinuclease ABC subunit C
MEKLLEGLPKIKITHNFYKELPETPGIYVYFKDKKVIYVGKAINLKRRISSYFDLDLETKTARMISEATNLSYIKVTSELEALLLEARLIRSYMPHYNIAAKDDKHPLYIVVTKEKYPRILSVRKLTAYSQGLIASYGPFPSSSNVKSVLKLVRRIFPYSDHKLGKRPCLYSHIGLCNPCPSEMAGIKNDELRIKNEKRYKQNIKNIKSILDGKIDKLSKNIEKEMNLASKKEDFEEALKLRNQIEQLEYITRPALPTDFYLENPNLYEDQRKKELQALRSLIVNCKRSLPSDGKLQITNLKRIECFDNAHLSGEYATASMVTFIDGTADKKYYRHFKIRMTKKGDDYESMREIAGRRAKHLADWGRPDLIIVDGGIGQVAAFKKGISNIPVVGIAKHPDRLIIGEDKIKLVGPALNLVSRMRDEAHRFARRYHHKLVSDSIKHPEVQI